jgi:hypothetical protein
MHGRVSGGLIDNAAQILDALPDSRLSASGNTRTDKQARTHWPCSRQTACILKAPHRRFVEALVQIGQHRGHAIERRVNIHGLQLDLERAVAVSLVTEAGFFLCTQRPSQVGSAEMDLLERLAMKSLARHFGKIDRQ